MCPQMTMSGLRHRIGFLGKPLAKLILLVILVARNVIYARPQGGKTRRQRLGAQNFHSSRGLFKPHQCLACGSHGMA